MTKSSNIYSPSGCLYFETFDGEWHPGDWRESSDSSVLKCLPGCKERFPRNAEAKRDILCDHLNGPGAIPWQWKTLVVPH